MSGTHPYPTGTSVRRLSIVFVAAALMISGCGGGDDATADGASAAFESPDDGESVAGGVELVMTADGVVIEPAGEVKSGAGHFHVIADAGCVDTGESIAKDADHVHFGSGASTGTVYLAPGKHALCLQVGDGQHAALAITDTIEVEVGISSQDEYCDVVNEVDTLTAALGDDDFAAAQLAAVNAGRLIEQLAAASDQVDSDARPDVEMLIGFMGDLLDAFSAAETAPEAEAAAYGPDGVLAGYSEDDLDAIEVRANAWLEGTCGLNILD